MSRIIRATGALLTHGIGGTMNPLPYIISTTPAYKTAGDTGADITITGAGFVSGITGTFNGNSRTVTYNSSTSVTMTLLTADLTTSGLYNIVLTNPSPFGGAGQPYRFLIIPTPATYPIWDTATQSGNITLSNSNWTATRGAAANAFYSIRSNQGKSSGKWYVEVKYNSAPTNNGIILGVTTSSQGNGSGSYPGDSSTSNAGKGYQSRPASSALHYSNGSSSVTNVNLNATTNDIVGMALDIGGGTLSWYKNNSEIHTANSGISGTYYICVGLYDNGMAVTLQTSLTYAPPSGYTQWSA